MSLAQAPSSPRRAPRPAPVAAPRRPPLTVVPPRPAPAARTPFVLLVATILSAGLVTLLLLNTALSQGSFVLTDLQRQAATLAAREQTLAQELAYREAPARLAESAAQLGMVPNPNPVFLRLADGAILGEPRKAVATAPPRVSAAPGASAGPVPSPGPVPSASPAPSTGPVPSADPASSAGPVPSASPAPSAGPPPSTDAPRNESPKRTAGPSAGGEIPVDPAPEVTR